MKTTFIIRDLPEDMIARISGDDTRAAYDHLCKWALGDLRHCVSVKHGSGTFGDRVRWNSIVRDGRALKRTIEPRRGYKLATFEPA